MKLNAEIKKVATVLTISALLVLSSFQAIYAQPVPIGDTVQSNPFESNPTNGLLIGTPTGGFTPTTADAPNARDGDTTGTNVNWRIGGGAQGVTVGVQQNTFESTPPGGAFTIGWVDIKVSYRASATTNDQYRIVYTTVASPAPADWIELQTWIGGASAKFDYNGAQDERAWSNKLPNDGTWDWTDIDNLKVQVETKRTDATEDGATYKFYLFEVWATIYEGSYPPVGPGVSIQPPVIKGLHAGDTFFIDVFVTNVVQMHSFGFVIRYNPYILTGIDYFSYNPFTEPAPSEVAEQTYLNIPPNGFDNARTGWTRVGSAPYLKTADYPTNYISATTDGATIGDFSFGDMNSPNYGGTVTIELNAMGDGDDQIELWLYDGATWQLADTVTPPSAWDPSAWQSSVNVGSILNTQAKINAAKVYLLKKTVGAEGEVIVDAMRLNVASGYATVNFSSYMGDPAGFTGSEPVVRVYFQADTDGTSLLHFDMAVLPNVYGDNIVPVYVYDGVFATNPVHDISVTDVAVNATQVMPGEGAQINVTVANQGTDIETFTVAAYYNLTPIGTPKTVTGMTPSTTQVVTFDWDTTGVDFSHYLISAEATLASDTDLGDNVFTDGVVIVGRHDIAVTNVVRAYPTLDVAISELEVLEVEIGEVVYINVTVQNEGNFPETFSLSASYNGGGEEGPRDIYGDYVLQTWSGISLDPGESHTLTYAWNTNTVVFGTIYGYPLNWTSCGMNARVTTEIPYERGVGYDNTGNNFYTDGVVKVTRHAPPPPPPSEYTRIYLPNQWISDGTPMGWHADDSSWYYTLPFDFPFYGTYYRSIHISSNGLISFTEYDSSLGNSISELARKRAIAVLWDDLRTDGGVGNDIYIWQPDSTRVIIRWQGVAYYNPSIAVNYEAVLATNGIIQLNYEYNNGPITATIGISNGIDEVLAEEVMSSNYINSILFTPYRPEHDLAVFLEAPSSIWQGQSAVLNATVYNFGANNETNVELQLLINNATADSVVIPELLAGFTYTLSYAWTPIEEGSYIVAAYALPVPSENITANNMATSIVYVITVENTFREDFSTPTLDPHWQVWRYPIRAPSPPDATYQQETRYSLTDTPGYLRYYLGSFTIEGASEPTWNGPSSPYWYYPSMHLYRMFESTDWSLEIQATYSSYSANAATQAFYVFYGDPQQRQEYRNNAIIVRASVWDAYHNVYVIENGVEKTVASLPINRYYDSFYYRIMRSGHQFTVQWSRDGVVYTTALTESLGSQIDSLPQGIGITGQAFYSYSDTYSQYDHIYLTPPPEHELAVSLEAPDYVLLGQSVSLNATVSNLGLNDEANVQLQLSVDGSLVNSVVIPELLTSSSYRLSYSWTPAIEGNYNITAYAAPVPSESDPTNNQRTKVVSVVRPLIQPIEGQWANYTIATPYGILLLNATYSRYLTPIQMYVTLWTKDPYGNTGTNWLTLNILNRQVESGMWSGYWYPLWIQTDVAIGSTVGILDRTGTVTESRYIEVGEYLVESWGLQVQYYDWLYTFWFDKVNGPVVAVEGMNSYYNYTERWQLTATNVPLVYLPRLRIQIAPESGPVGTAVTVTGVNAMPNATLEIYYDETYMGTATADNDGNFVFTLAVPPTTRGIYTIRAVDLTTGISDSKVFTVLPSISVTPLSGPMGSTVQVSGLGFVAYEEVVVCFEDMQIGKVYADSSGSFTATFSIPLSQSGSHLIKAWYSTEYVQTTFTVTDVEPLDVQIDAGTIYFKGETAEFYVLTAFKGKRIDVTVMNATLYMYNGTTRTLTYQRIAIGFYRVRYTISGKTGMTGTYTLFVEAGAITSTVKAYGTSIKTFLVKPTWEKEAPKIAALSLASVGLVSAMVMLWRKEKKKLI